jgi:predicted outer membrane repeat protein
MKRNLLFTALALVGVSQAHAVCFVNAKAMGSNTGTSWIDAYTDLNSALTDTRCGEIWVTQGVYTPTKGPDRTATFKVMPGQSVYGGFAGTEDSRDKRDFTTNVSVLSGDIDQNDANVATTQIDLTQADLNGSNSYNVVTMDGVSGASIGAATVLDGFTITGGDAQPSYASLPGGGGLICSGSGAGHACNPTLSNLTFKGNRATHGLGGALLLDGSYAGESSPILSHVTFSGNEGFEGGAIYANAQYSGRVSPIISGATFSQNSAYDSGGAMSVNASQKGTSLLTISASIFDSNSCRHSGGAVSSVSDYYGNSTLQISDSLLSRNVTSTDFGSGGAVSAGAYSGDSAVSINRTTFDENQSIEGGALDCEGQGYTTCTMNVTNSTFTNNTAQGGGAVFVSAQIDASSDVEINNSTFSGNHAVSGASWDGSGGAVADIANTGSGQLQISNSIFWNDDSSTDEEVQIVDAIATMKNDVVTGGCPTGSACTGTSDEDPLLESLGFHWGPTPVMRPGFGGSAIDAGDDASCELVDQRNFARPQGKHCDIGAVEMRQPSDDIVYPGGFFSLHSDPIGTLIR